MDTVRHVVKSEPIVKKVCSGPEATLFAPLICRRLHVSLLGFLLFVHATIPRSAAGQGDSPDEYALKAAMLYNLTRFVEWPPSAYADPQAPTVLCIIGRDPFGSYLTSTILNRTVDGRPVVLLHPQNGRGYTGCHLLYISSTEKKGMAGIVAILNNSSVLTVGEMTHFAAQGGMVQFSLEDQQVRFNINLDGACRAGLKISAKLLTIARIVKASEVSGL